VCRKSDEVARVTRAMRPTKVRRGTLPWSSEEAGQLLQLLIPTLVLESGGAERRAAVEVNVELVVVVVRVVG
jgi:hypothetical protein